ncbi:MAG: PEGA domain-containing protein, partial [Myxococcota bacterium]|nr:PEGA domain-containing protein [Myxococcota bacterium]
MRVQRHSVPTTLSALALAVLLGWSASAGATDAREVVVVDLSADTRENAQIRHEVIRAVRRHEDYDIRNVDSILNAGAEADEQSNIRTAMAFKEAGIEALERGDASEASDQLENAAGLIERHFGQLPDVKTYRELLLLLGDAQLSAGLGEVARETFNRAALFRARPADAPGGMSTDAEAALNKAVAQMAEMAPGAISLTTSPAHAEVWLNGRYKGITPKTVAGLPAGKHILVIRKPGYVRQTQQVRADPDELTTYSFDMEPSRKKPVWDQLRITLEE